MKKNVYVFIMDTNIQLYYIIANIYNNNNNVHNKLYKTRYLFWLCILVK